MAESLKVEDGRVVSMHYTLHVNGEVVDSSNEDEPLQFIQGMGHIIPGLERELYDMQIGDQKRVEVAAADGYGEEQPEAFMDVPREVFPSNIPIEKGMELELKDKSGHPAFARIDGISHDSVRLNMNHPLAGKQLNFEIRITDVRPATEDETAHGHVHAGGAEA